MRASAVGLPTVVQFILLAALAAGCDRHAGAADRAGPSSSASALAPWQPVDEGFRGCEGG